RNRNWEQRAGQGGGAAVRRAPSLRRIFAIACVTLFGACTDSAGPNPPPPPPTGLIISNPIPVGVVVVGTGLSAFPPAASTSSVDSVAYVALTPGTASGGSSATIRRIGSTSSVDAPVFDGGFDP